MKARTLVPIEIRRLILAEPLNATTSNLAKKYGYSYDQVKRVRLNSVHYIRRAS